MIKAILKVGALIALIALNFSVDEFALLLPLLPRHSVELIIHFFIFSLSGQLIVDLISLYYRRRRGLRARQTDTFILGVQNILYLLIAGAFILTILGFYRIEIRAVFTSLSIVAAAIAIVSKDYISEIISGIIISFSGEINIDDYIKIGTHKGKVIDLTLTKIALLNEDDDIIFIPNNKVYSNELVNYTQKATRRVSIEFEIGFQHVRTIEELERDLIESLSDFREDLDPDNFYLRIVELKKDSIELKFQYLINRRERDLERAIRRKTVRRVVNYVKQNWDSTVQPKVTPPVVVEEA